MDEKHVILIVDDTPENLLVLGDLLEMEEHEVLIVTNGPEPLKQPIATLGRPDSAGCMDGYTLTERVVIRTIDRKITLYIRGHSHEKNRHSWWWHIRPGYSLAVAGESSQRR